MPQETETKQTPPYGTYATFKRFVSQLEESLVPDQVDDHTLSKFSGSERAALLPGLKFLGLIDDSKAPTEDLRTLVKAKRAGKEEWQKELGRILERSYNGITDGVDMERGTGTQLDRTFRDMGIASSVWPKCVRFYLQAVEDTGVTLSPYMKTKRRRSAPKKRATPKKTADQKDQDQKRERAGEPPPPPPPSGDDDEVPAHFERLPIPGVKGGYIQYPVKLTAADCTMYETMVSALRKLVEVQGEEGGAS